MPTAHIVALGVRCAVGVTAESAAAAIRAGIGRVEEHPFMLDGLGEPLRGAREPTLDPALDVAPRVTAMAAHGLREVLTKMGPISAWPDHLPLLLALPEPRPGFLESRAKRVLEDVHAALTPAEARIVRVEPAACGHAGALLALHDASTRVARGQADVCIAGGADSYFDADTLDWLESDLRLAREGVRAGFAPGEGAAFVVVASDRGRAQLGLPSLATVRGAASAMERRSAKSDAGLLGEALSEAVLQATRNLALPRERIEDIYGDINGERPRTEEWALTLLRASDRLRDGTEYVTPAGATGDLGAATGTMSCALAVAAWQRGYARGARALLWGSSWGGLRGAIVLERSQG